MSGHYLIGIVFYVSEYFLVSILSSVFNACHHFWAFLILVMFLNIHKKGANCLINISSIYSEYQHSHVTVGFSHCELSGFNRSTYLYGFFFNFYLLIYPSSGSELLGQRIEDNRMLNLFLTHLLWISSSRCKNPCIFLSGFAKELQFLRSGAFWNSWLNRTLICQKRHCISAYYNIKYARMHNVSHERTVSPMKYYSLIPMKDTFKVVKCPVYCVLLSLIRHSLLPIKAIFTLIWIFQGLQRFI